MATRLAVVLSIGMTARSSKPTAPRKVDILDRSCRREVSSLQKVASRGCTQGERITQIACALVGRPYVSSPLIGGPTTLERLVVRLDGFDCVTFVETVLALARSRDEQQFLRELIHLRYRGARIGWRTRLHYFSEWMEANATRGAITQRTHGPGSRLIDKKLSIIPELGVRSLRLPVVPRRSLALARERIVVGSIIAFASLRTQLDFFHVGIILHGPPKTKGRHPQLLLCHAARSRGRVLIEPLDDFLGRNRMRGIAFAAPCP